MTRFQFFAEWKNSRKIRVKRGEEGFDNIGWGKCKSGSDKDICQNNVFNFEHFLYLKLCEILSGSIRSDGASIVKKKEQIYFYSFIQVSIYKSCLIRVYLKSTLQFSNKFKSEYFFCKTNWTVKDVSLSHTRY